jgi:ParB-like chromosome segregation protein Spo0J
MQFEYVDIDKVVPYVNNSRVHPPEQINKLRASLREFGFVNPILIDKEYNVIAGHGRLEAARLEKVTEVPCVFVDHLSAVQQKAYVLADNRLALDAVWDSELLKLEVEGLTEAGFDIGVLGFEDFEINLSESLGDSGAGVDDTYSRRIKAPQYQITGACPEIEDLYDDYDYASMIEQIEDSDIPDDVKEFLMVAATRHIEFNFRNIAEFYAHASAEVQELMELSGLVIIDLDDAIANGYVRLSREIDELRDQDGKE